MRLMNPFMASDMNINENKGAHGRGATVHSWVKSSIGKRVPILHSGIPMQFNDGRMVGD